MGNKAIIITGANGAIASVLTEEYLQEGYFVFALINKNRFRLTDLEEKYSHSLFTQACNLEDYKALEEAIKELETKHGNVPDKLIHTAALRSSDFLPLTETDPVKWSSIINSNIMATYNLLHILIPYYQKNKMGRIVLLGSNISRTGLKNGSAYAVSKGALGNLVRTVTLEYGKDNILINVLSPGPVQADQSHFPEAYRKFREEYFAKELRGTPLQKLVEPLDIFNACDFLLSDQNRLISGEEIFITGGKL
ncbi:SDR family oxidoreductase [bacterium]|nr:SDR family oxidoreductase [bacterium]